MTETMSRLERRYRRLLHLLPAYYREQWQEDMVATFLATRQPDDPDDAPIVAEYGSPGFAEVRSVLGLAVRLRLGGAGAPLKYLIAGDAVRKIALLGMLFHAGMALLSIGFWVTSLGATPDPLPSVAQALSWLWIPAYLTLLFGRRRVSTALGVLAVGAPLYMLGTSIAYGFPVLFSHGYRALLAALVVCAIVGFHREAPRTRRRPWLVALPGVALLVLAVEYANALGRIADPASTGCVLIVLSGLMFLLTPRWSWRHDRVAWSAALATLAVAALGERVITLLEPASQQQGPLLLWSGIVQAVAVVAIAKALTIFAHRTARAATLRHTAAWR